MLKDHAISITAVLKPLHGGFSLDFDVNGVSKRAYLLKEIDPKQRRLRALTSFNSSSDEAIRLAQTWSKLCTCADSWKDPGEKWYPKRLLDLRDIRAMPGFADRDSLTFLSEHGDVQRAKVWLVETDHAFIQSSSMPTKLSAKFKSNDKKKMSRKEREDYRYVTLSHCWGKPKSAQGRLRMDYTTHDRFKEEGIELRQLSKTFRDAILFACHLEKVGFIWIDSLCIMQRSEVYSSRPGDQDGDWLEQSGQMGKVYHQAFLNISATAAIDGDQGLFFSRQPEDLWEDEINVNYTGTNPFDSVRTGNIDGDQLKLCTLIDVSFWDELVESAPVNRRGWVFQERLLAPRVLHFCRNQIAWECAEFKDAEGHPEMSPALKAALGTIVNEGRFKDLAPSAGLTLRMYRLNGVPDPDEHMADLGVYELWKHVVEVYSKTQLTVSSDKLIALSGIAEYFCKRDSKLFTIPNMYIAGMWRNNLESQLLWQVNECFREGVFENPARRDVTRAPSFSWASIDAPYGITYPDVTDYGARRAGRKCTRAQGRMEQRFPEMEPMVEVLEHHITLTDVNNEFGMIEEAKLLLQPRYLCAVQLRRFNPALKTPHSWSLKHGVPISEGLSSTSRTASKLEHFNLYLDAPEFDVDIFLDEAQLYCMPVAYGERTVRKTSRYLYCLLLKYEGHMDYRAKVQDESKHEVPSTIGQHPVFKRVGITKLSRHMEEETQKALMAEEYNERIWLC